MSSLRKLNSRLTSASSSVSRRAQGFLLLLRFQIVNHRSHKPIVGHASCVVTMTTHGARISKVFAAIESIGRGSTRPRRVILYLDDPNQIANLPKSLSRLLSRGLEVQLSPKNFGPHTKYYPYVISLDCENPCKYDLVTADDDILYPATWLSRLLAAQNISDSQRKLIFCHRAKRFTFSETGIAPYMEWPDVTDSRPSTRAFATGVSGVLYPSDFLMTLKAAGEEFLSVCPRADDVWLHFLALKSGYEVTQISSSPRLFPFVPGSQTDSSLVKANAFGGANDKQILATYSQEELLLLTADGS